MPIYFYVYGTILLRAALLFIINGSDLLNYHYSLVLPLATRLILFFIRPKSNIRSPFFQPPF